MAEKPPLTIEPLSSTVDRSSFSCGTASLDDYCRFQMGQDAKKNLARPYVLVSDGATALHGYYTLSCTGIPTSDLPDEIKKRIPYELAPAILLGRLAVAEQMHGQKLGKYLLMDALRRSLEFSRSVAATGVVVDAKDEDAATFYERIGFIRFTESRLRLYLPMKTIEQLFRGE